MGVWGGRGDWDERHESCGDGLHADGEEDGEAAEIGTEAGEEREDAQKEGDDGEEQGDQEEDPGESADVEVVVSVVDEGLRDTGLGAKVPHWVEGECWARRGAVGVAAVGDAADVEICPSRWVSELCVGVGDIAGISLQKIAGLVL